MSEEGTPILLDLFRSIFFLLLSALLFSLVRKKWFMRSHDPPGPTGLPLIGYLPFLREDAYKQFIELSHFYKSNVIQVKLLNENFIILNDYESIKEAYTGPNNGIFSGRPQEFSFLRYAVGQAVTYSEGTEWKNKRKAFVESFAHQGMGKIKFEPQLNKISSQLVTNINNNHGHDFDIYELLTLAAGNSVTQMAFSKMYELEDEEYQKLITASRDITYSYPGFDSFLSGTIFKLFYGNSLMNKRWTQLNEAGKKIRQTLEKIIRERIEAGTVDDFEDYISFFFSDKCLTEVKDVEILAIEMIMMINAGTETTATTLYFGLNFMANHPEIQKRVQKEIDEVIGNDRIPSYSDRHEMPYSESVIAEIQRRASLVAFGLARSNIKRGIISGYKIQERSTILTNLYAVSRDKRFFQNPDEFDPSNFYDESSNSFKKIEAHLPFSIGKRNCAGEPLARQELFVFFTLMVQRFNWLPPKGHSKCDFKVYEGLTRIPLPFKIRAVERGKRMS